MQGNVNGLFVDNEFPDSWIELHNTSDNPVNLQGWSLATSRLDSDRYTFQTPTVIKPNDYLLIFCDKDTIEPHVPFRLKCGKGELFLFDSENRMMQHFVYPAQPTQQVSYGVTPSGKIGYLLNSTPGAKNCNTVCDFVIPSPIYSHLGGVYTEPFNLRISLPDVSKIPSDAKLCISTDGHEPTLRDSIPSNEFNRTIDSTIAIRAKIISDSAFCPLSLTQTFIFLEEPTTLPVLSLVTDPLYFYDPNIGILVGELDHNPNWGYDWRRPLNIELYVGDDHHLLFNQMVECRVHGGWSRRENQKSLNVYAHKRFGKSNLNTSNLWPDKPHVKKVESFILRNSGGDINSAHIRDAFAQTLLARYSDHLDYQAYRPCIYFENGVYKGLYDIRERSNDENIQSNYPKIGEFDMIEQWDDVKCGSDSLLREFVTMLQSPSLLYGKVYENLEVDEFLDHYVLQSFAANTDYPFNNIALWRECKDGAKWHIFLQDVDRFLASWIRIDTNMFQHFYVNSHHPYNYWLNDATRLHYFFQSNSFAKKELIKRFVVNMGDFMHPRVMTDLLNELASEIEPEIQRHFNAWNGKTTATKLIDRWYDQVQNFLPNAFVERREILYNQITEYFSLAPPQKLYINRNDVTAYLYGRKLTQSVFDGKYFADIPLEIKLDSPSEILIEETDNIETWTTTLSGSYVNYVPHIPRSSIIVTIGHEETSVSNHSLSNATPNQDCYDLLGRKISNPTNGIFIRNGRKYKF